MSRYHFHFDERDIYVSSLRRIENISPFKYKLADGDRTQGHGGLIDLYV